jgi:hypothetical protein
MIMQTEGHVAALRDPNNTLLVCGWRRVSVSVRGFWGCVDLSEALRVWNPTSTFGDWTWERLASSKNFVKESLGDTLEASYR